MKRDESIDVQIEISAGWKVVKGFCVELHRKNFSQIFANQSDWVGVRLSEEGYIIWWASASLEVSAAVNNMYKHEYTCVRLKMYLKITHTHRCTVGIHVPWAETQRVLLCRHPTAHSTGLMPWNFHWSSLNTEYEIQNTYTTPAILPTFRLRSRCGRCRRCRHRHRRRRCRRWCWRLCVTLPRKQHWRWRAAQRKADKGASSQVTHGWGKIACESRPEKRNLSRISFALGLSVCASYTAKISSSGFQPHPPPTLPYFP